MKKLLLCSVLMIPGVAQAADLMPAKAPRLNAFTDGSGFYCGLGSEAAVQQTSVTGTPLLVTSLAGGDIKAAGGAVGGDCGWIKGNATSWHRIEFTAMYQNITGSNVVGSVASRWAATGEVDVGFDWIQRIFAVVGNLGVTFPSFSPSLPSNIAVANVPRQYVGGGLRMAGIDGAFFGGTGSTISVAPMLKSGYIWQTVDASGQPNGGALDLYAWVAFPMRGFTINNAFAPNGLQATLGAGASLGTTYGLGAHYDFAL